MVEPRQFEVIRTPLEETALRELGQQLAHEMQNIYDLEAQKKQLSAELTTQIKAAEKHAAELALSLNKGSVDTEVEVLYLYDEPKTGMKRIVRADTNEILRDEEMTPQEKQRNLGFGPEV